MSVQIGSEQLLTARGVTQEFGIHESKLKRLAQLGIIPSIPVGDRMNGKGPEIRLYDLTVLKNLDPQIWKQQTRGVKKQGENQPYYSRLRRK